MNKLKGLVAAAVIGGTIALGALGTAHAKDKFTYPQVPDSRMYIYEIDQDFVRIYAPPDFGHKQIEQTQMYNLALWACQMYDRLASDWLNYVPEHDQGGNVFLFACGTP